MLKTIFNSLVNYIDITHTLVIVLKQAMYG